MQDPASTTGEGDSSDVDAADVIAYIRNGGGSLAKSSPSKTEPVVLTDEAVAAAADRLSGGKSPAEEKTSEPRPQVDIPLPPNADLSQSLDPLHMAFKIGGEADAIVVSDAEKDIFFKAALLDEPVTFDIPMMGDRTSVRVTSMSSYMVDLYTRMIDYEEFQMRAETEAAAKNKVELPSVTTMQVGSLVRSSLCMTRMQQCTIALQCMTATSPGSAGKPLQPFAATGDLDKDIPALLEYCKTVVASMSAPRRAMLFRAVQIFEIKQKMLSEALYSGSFWKPAVTS